MFPGTSHVDPQWINQFIFNEAVWVTFAPCTCQATVSSKNAQKVELRAGSDRQGG